MSIERMKRIWVVAERDRLRELLDFIASLKAVHVTEVTVPDEESDEGFSREQTDHTLVDRTIANLHHILEVMDAYSPPKRGIAENFISLPVELSPEEMKLAVDEIDVDAMNAELTELSDESTALGHRVEEIILELHHLGLWMGIECSACSVFKHCVGFLGTVTARMRKLMDESERVGDILVLNELGRGKDNRTLLQVVALGEHKEEAEELLRTFEFAPLPLPYNVARTDMIEALQVEKAGYVERIDEIHDIMSEAAGKNRDGVTAVLAHWETRKDVIHSHEGTLGSKRMGVIAGYIRVREIDQIAGAIQKEFPAASVSLKEPKLEENVPVNLTDSGFFSPGSFLTNMFGLPHYRGFDPSSFIMFVFLMFFGFCFGDVVYGVFLIAFSMWVAKKLRKYPAYRNFFKLFAWGGVFTVIAGALTGSWAANLPKYLHEMFGISFPLAMSNSIQIINPVTDPVAMLLVVLGVGTICQFYGIILSMYRDIRLKDYAGAVFDGMLWLIVLPGFMMMAASLFGAPEIVLTVGLWLFVPGAIGLMLTQGRKEEGIAAKIITGIVSIYGIMGSYGVTGFLGDVLSYCRLLALGLVTAIIGGSFNMIANLIADAIPWAWVGVVMFVVVVVFGHIFNFVISILGAFVHSARLIFLEVFGRFYESNAIKFVPLGTSDRVYIDDKEAGLQTTQNTGNV